MSNKITCTKRLHFDAAHRVVGHENKCKYLHGHRYEVEVTFSCADNLDEIGRVIDFGEIKCILGEWIDNKLDHNVILNKSDKELGSSLEKITGQKVFYLDSNPTAENIARYIFGHLTELFRNHKVVPVKLRLYETPNSFAEVVL